MSKALHAVSPPNATQLLARILDEPALPEKVAALSPPVLAELVRRIGLEDAGELVALATTEQLVGVFDEDLWHNERPGEEESFDPKRFALWVEVLLEAGDTFAADRLAELPEDLLTLGLHGQMLVLDVDELAAQMEEGDRDETGQLDKVLGDWQYEELDNYQLMAKNADGWDAVISAVLALDRDHHALLCRVLDRCVKMSSATIEDNGGLYEVLTSDEMLASDVAAEREDRRTAAGYVAPTTAASFLKLAASETGDGALERDPVTRAHFRDGGHVPARARTAQRGGAAGRDLDALVSAKRAPGKQMSDLPVETGSFEPAERTLSALRALAERAEALFTERQEELAYLANVLVAGATVERRRVRPVEAIRAAAAVVGVGTERVPGGASVAQSLERHPLDVLFRLGWSELHRRARQGGKSCAYNDLDVAEPHRALTSEAGRTAPRLGPRRKR